MDLINDILETYHSAIPVCLLKEKSLLIEFVGTC